MNGLIDADDIEPTTSEATALAAIVAWSADCPPWQKDALRRLCSKDRLDETDFTPLMTICKGDTASVVSIDASHVRDPAAGSAVVTLQALHSIKHVNALGSGLGRDTRTRARISPG